MAKLEMSKTLGGSCFRHKWPTTITTRFAEWFNVNFPVTPTFSFSNLPGKPMIIIVAYTNIWPYSVSVTLNKTRNDMIQIKCYPRQAIFHTKTGFSDKRCTNWSSRVINILSKLSISGSKKTSGLESFGLIPIVGLATLSGINPFFGLHLLLLLHPFQSYGWIVCISLKPTWVVSSASVSYSLIIPNEV